MKIRIENTRLQKIVPSRQPDPHLSTNRADQQVVDEILSQAGLGPWTRGGMRGAPPNVLYGQGTEHASASDLAAAAMGPYLSTMIKELSQNAVGEQYVAGAELVLGLTDYRTYDRMRLDALDKGYDPGEAAAQALQKMEAAGYSKSKSWPFPSYPS